MLAFKSTSHNRKLLATAISVALGVGAMNAFATVSTFSNSNFTMLDPNGNLVGGAINVSGTFDDSKICFTQSCTQDAMQFASSEPFFGAPWTAHNIRVFGPGTYTIDACPLPVTDAGIAADGSAACRTNGAINGPATLVVGPGQLGAHVLFDYAPMINIDVILRWDLNGSFGSPIYNISPSLGTAAYDSSTIWNLDSVDSDGDGIRGFFMLDGRFPGFHANFNFNDILISFPDLTGMTLSQAGNASATLSSPVIDTTGGMVTVDSGLAAGFTFDWSSSDTALITACGGCNLTAATFVFDPTSAAITPGSNLNLNLTVKDAGTQLPTDKIITVQMGCPAEGALLGADTDGDGIINGPGGGQEACGDTDSDGILDYLDPVALTANQISADLPAGSVATSTPTTTLTLGTMASSQMDSNGNPGSGIQVDINIANSSVTTTCGAGCFDYVVSGGGLAGVGTSTQVVLPLPTALPATPLASKYDPSTQQWTAFAEDTNNALGSAASIAGVCPLPGDAAYESGGVPNGLIASNDCVQVTIEDNGPNDSNATAGTIADPIGFGGSSASIQTVNSKPASANAGGCTLAGSATTAEKRADWWLLGSLLGWLGLSMHRRRAR